MQACGVCAPCTLPQHHGDGGFWVAFFNVAVEPPSMFEAMPTVGSVFGAAETVVAAAVCPKLNSLSLTERERGICAFVSCVLVLVVDVCVRLQFQKQVTGTSSCKITLHV
jgi:hypothetical protein